MCEPKGEYVKDLGGLGLETGTDPATSEGLDKLKLIN